MKTAPPITGYGRTYTILSNLMIVLALQEVINTFINTLNYMAPRRLSISEEIYEALVALKKEREGFTELIKWITAPLRRKKLSEFAGLMAGYEYDDFEKAALEVRHFKSS